MRTVLMFLAVPAYFAGMILAHKYGHYHVDGVWLLPLLVALGVMVFRDWRANRRQHTHH